MVEYFTIIENTHEAAKEFGFNYGADSYTITKEDIQALLDGKALAAEVNGGEYSIFIALEEGDGDVQEDRA